MLCVYFILGIALLALRYWVPLKINDWRPEIQSQISQSLNLAVSLDHINLRWYGWQPSFQIENIVFKNHQQETLLQIPSVNADLNWMALFKKYVGLIRLNVKGMDLTITRTARDNLNVLGQDIDLSADDENISKNTDKNIWLSLLDQPYISFTGSTIRWLDLYKSAPELRFDVLTAVLEQDRNNDLGLSLNIKTPQMSSTNLQLKAQINKADLHNNLENLTNFNAWLGVSNFAINDWQDWLHIPAGVKSDDANVQVWFDSKTADRKLTVLSNLNGFGYESFGIEQQKFDIGQLNLLLNTRFDQFSLVDLLEKSDDYDLPNDIDFSLNINDIYILEDDIFVYPLDISSLKTKGKFSSKSGSDFSLSLTEIDLVNNDIQFNASGSWRTGTGAGVSDFTGKIKYANLASIYKYLPNDVDRDAHDWLKDGLLSGDLSNGEFYLRGDLNEFPFGQKPEKGDFLVAGGFSNAKIEFVPDAADDEKWPQLFNMDGFASLNRSSLYLKSDAASMLPIPGMSKTKDNLIKLSNLQAVIPDIEYESVLSVKGNSEATGPTYLDLINNTPLAEMLGDTFAEASASGVWQVPLSLEVPLSNSIDTKVNGEVVFNHGELQFFDAAPRFTDLLGRVGFDETGIHINPALSAKFLGGNVNIVGDLGGKNTSGLSAKGQITAEALKQYVAVHGMSRLSGTIDYLASLNKKNNIYALTMSSDTKGLGIDLPAPFSKPDTEQINLKVDWSESGKTDESLKISYGDILKMDLLHKKNSSHGSYFYAAAVGLQRAAKLTKPSGLTLDISYPFIDLDYWGSIASEFEKPLDPKRTKTKIIWPELDLLAIQADQLRTLGTRMDMAVVRAERKDKTDWSLNVSSKQTNGNIKWQFNDGAFIGTVKANFDQLSLGDDPNDNSSLLPTNTTSEVSINESINIPAMVIQANDLKIYGRSFGKLNIEGTRDAKLKRWVLDRLRLGSDESAMLKGTGVWHLSGEHRGLQLNADVDIKNLGLWMDNADWTDILGGGSGLLKGKFFWKNLPWDTETKDLNGNLKAELANGRFIKLNSSSAKLLELLSLQSISRLNKLERGLFDLTEEGFPFDQLYGNMELKEGGVDIIDYKITGPVATILLEGKANIIRRDMDLDAVVVPNIDVSGAAVAAGIAINPIVGLGAFITQWLLKEPLAKSMTVRYKVSGSWDDPKTTEVPVK